jgi:3-dehydroquinate synthase
MQHIYLRDYKISYGPAPQAIRAYISSKNYTSICILVDENSKKHCLPLLDLEQPYHLIEIESGESHKGLSTCEFIWANMASIGVDRHGLLINLGGGVIGDMGGFCASCYMRGIDFVQIPTTLLSQVDASIGGKLAVDFKGLKNFIGLFQNPQEVIVDYTFIHTLSEAELRSGYAEMIKHALIQNVDIWDRIRSCDNWRNLDWQSEIYPSILIKKEVVEYDPTEKGLRKILNFGHTIGHAIESLSFETDSPLLHGEAIAIGMICESYLSMKYGSLSADSYQEIRSYVLSVYDQIPVENLLNRTDDIIEKLKSDKKNKGGKYMFSLLNSIGNCTYDVVINDYQITESINAYIV